MPPMMTNPAAPPAQVSPYADILKQLIARPPSVSDAFGAVGGHSPVVNAFANMTNSANQANYQRGRGILDLLSRQGESSKLANKDIFDQENASVDQSMIDRGLSGLSVGDSLKQGVARNYARSNMMVDEGVAGSLAHAAEGFQQQGPDLSMLMQFLSAAHPPAQNSAPYTVLPDTNNPGWQARNPGSLGVTSNPGAGAPPGTQLNGAGAGFSPAGSAGGGAPAPAPLSPYEQMLQMLMQGGDPMAEPIPSM